MSDKLPNEIIAALQRVQGKVRKTDYVQGNRGRAGNAKLVYPDPDGINKQVFVATNASGGKQGGILIQDDQGGWVAFTDQNDALKHRRRDIDRSSEYTESFSVRGKVGYCYGTQLKWRANSSDSWKYDWEIYVGGWNQQNYLVKRIPYIHPTQSTWTLDTGAPFAVIDYRQKNWYVALAYRYNKNAVNSTAAIVLEYYKNGVLQWRMDDYWAALSASLGLPPAGNTVYLYYAGFGVFSTQTQGIFAPILYCASTGYTYCIHDNQFKNIAAASYSDVVSPPGGLPLGTPGTTTEVFEAYFKTPFGPKLGGKDSVHHFYGASSLSLDSTNFPTYTEFLSRNGPSQYRLFRLSEDLKHSLAVNSTVTEYRNYLNSHTAFSDAIGESKGFLNGLMAYKSYAERHWTRDEMGNYLTDIQIYPPDSYNIPKGDHPLQSTKLTTAPLKVTYYIPIISTGYTQQDADRSYAPFYSDVYPSFITTINKVDLLNRDFASGLSNAYGEIAFPAPPSTDPRFHNIEHEVRTCRVYVYDSTMTKLLTDLKIKVYPVLYGYLRQDQTSNSTVNAYTFFNASFGAK